MPYIETSKRKKIVLPHLLPILRMELEIGDIHFIFAKLIVSYLTQNGVSYRTLKDIDGLLGTASKEFYRRVVAPYEDSKIEYNGDVYSTVIMTSKESENQP